MKTTVIATYLTRTGKVAAEIKRFEQDNGRVSFSWIGLYGAGCGCEESVIGNVKFALARRKGIVLASGSDVAR
jgi:hypothetical protein